MPASTRISARKKCVQGHISVVNVSLDVQRGETKRNETKRNETKRLVPPRSVREVAGILLGRGILRG